MGVDGLKAPSTLIQIHTKAMAFSAMTAILNGGRLMIYVKDSLPEYTLPHFT